MAGPYTGAIPTVTSGQTSGVSAVINDLVNAAKAKPGTLTDWDYSRKPQ